MKNTHQKFISGGGYSSNPENYLKNGYNTSINENSLYEVINSTMAVFKSGNKKNNNNTSFILISISIIIGIIIYKTFKICIKENINSYMENAKIIKDGLKEVNYKLDYLFKTKGIGIITGNPGSGKTTSLSTGTVTVISLSSGARSAKRRPATRTIGSVVQYAL